MVSPCKTLSRPLSIGANHLAWFEGKERSSVVVLDDRGITTAIQQQWESVLWMNRVRANRPISGRPLPTVAKLCSNTRTFLNYLAKALSVRAPTAVIITEPWRASSPPLFHEGLGQGVTITTRLVPRFVYLNGDCTCTRSLWIILNSPNKITYLTSGIMSTVHLPD